MERRSVNIIKSMDRQDKFLYGVIAVAVFEIAFQVVVWL
jgi:hypothetical protein